MIICHYTLFAFFNFLAQLRLEEAQRRGTLTYFYERAHPDGSPGRLRTLAGRVRLILVNPGWFHPDFFTKTVAEASLRVAARIKKFRIWKQPAKNYCPSGFFLCRYELMSPAIIRRIVIAITASTRKSSRFMFSLTIGSLPR